MNSETDQCKYCPHIRFQHSNDEGACLVGMSMNQLCYCIGFCEKELVEIG